MARQALIPFQRPDPALSHAYIKRAQRISHRHAPPCSRTQDAAAARASDTAAGLLTLGSSPAAPHGNIQVVIDDKIRWGHIVTRMCEDS
jgi:hypothetical protein